MSVLLFFRQVPKQSLKLSNGAVNELCKAQQKGNNDFFFLPQPYCSNDKTVYLAKTDLFLCVSTILQLGELLLVILLDYTLLAGELSCNLIY